MEEAGVRRVQAGAVEALDVLDGARRAEAQPGLVVVVGVRASQLVRRSRRASPARSAATRSSSRTPPAASTSPSGVAGLVCREERGRELGVVVGREEVGVVVGTLEGQPASTRRVRRAQGPTIAAAISVADRRDVLDVRPHGDRQRIGRWREAWSRQQREEARRLAADDRSPRVDVCFGQPVGRQLCDEVAEVDDQGQVGDVDGLAPTPAAACWRSTHAAYCSGLISATCSDEPSGDHDRVGADASGLAQPGVVVDPGLRRVGDAAVAGEEVDVRERCLRIGGDQRARRRQPVGDVLGDDDVGSTWRRRGRAPPSPTYSSRPAVTPSLYTPTVPGRHEVAEVHDAVVERQLLLHHLQCHVLVLRRAHDPLQLLADLGGQQRLRAGRRTGRRRSGSDLVGVLQLDQPVVGPRRVGIRHPHERSDAERAGLAVQGDVVELRRVQALTDEGEPERQRRLPALPCGPSVDVGHRGERLRRGPGRSSAPATRLTVEQPEPVPLVVQARRSCCPSGGREPGRARRRPIELGDRELQRCSARRRLLASAPSARRPCRHSARVWSSNPFSSTNRGFWTAGWVVVVVVVEPAGTVVDVGVEPSGVDVVGVAVGWPLHPASSAARTTAAARTA